MSEQAAGVAGAGSTKSAPVAHPSQVAVDVPRTAPGVAFFHQPRIQKSLERILYIWGLRWGHLPPLMCSPRSQTDMMRCPLSSLNFLSPRLLSSPLACPALPAPNDLVTPFMCVFAGEHLEGPLDAWCDQGLPDAALLDVEADCYWCAPLLPPSSQAPAAVDSQTCVALSRSAGKGWHRVRRFFWLTPLLP